MSTLQVLIEHPPVYDNICASIGVPSKTAVFTYGKILYNPGNGIIADHLFAHEELHSKRQGETPELWWGKYLRDTAFRLDEEAQAYGRQYAFLCKTFKDRNRRALIAMDLGRFLASPLYGKICTLPEAINLPPSAYCVKSVSSRRAFFTPFGILEGEMSPMPRLANISAHLARK